MFLEPDLEEVFRVLTAFQVSSSQEVAAFLTLVWWIQGMTPITITVVGVARMTV